MLFAFAIEFQRNPVMVLPHLAGDDKVVRHIPVTSS